MHGTGVPLATPFTEDGDVDHTALADLVEWTVDRGADFLVPCASPGEAELLTQTERAAVIETVVDTAPASADVLAGTGHPGLRETLEQTQLATAADTDAALVVTPFYYDHDESALASSFHRLADEADVPIYLYDDPVHTRASLDRDMIADLATHPSIGGLVDASGDLTAFQRRAAATTNADFELFVGSGGVYAAGLDVGAAGGVPAFANVLPERANEIYELHRAGKDQAARDLNKRLVDLHRAITAEYGVPGLKAAMRARELPVGRVRPPHHPVDEAAKTEIERLVESALP